MHGTIIAQFEQVVNDHPNATAVVDGDRCCCYSELMSRARRIASGISRAGGEVGEPVILHLRRSLEYIEAVLGVLLCGGLCVPIDPDTPENRKSELIESVEGRLVINGGSVVDTKMELSQPAHMGRERHAEEYRQSAIVTSSSPALSFFTSGSMGVRNQVTLSNEAVKFVLPFIDKRFALSEADTHVFRTAVDFVSVIRQVLWPLLTGGKIVVLQPGLEKDVKHLGRVIREHGVTFLTSIPSVFRYFVAGNRGERFDTLRHVAFGAEVLDAKTQEIVYGVCEATAHNIYAMTEAPIVSMFTCDRNDIRVAPIGPPVPGMSYRVVAPSGRLVARGESGAIAIAGCGVSRDLAERASFVDEETGSRFVVTGDRGLLAASGEVFYEGREDDVVKVRGYRVALVEVERVVRAYEGVAEAVVLKERYGATGERLVAFVELERELMERPTSADLRSYVASVVPDNMVPQRVVIVKEWPRLPSGKVDRQSLLTVDVIEKESELTAHTMRTRVHAVISEITGNHVIEDTDSFFNLGGTSLDLVEAVVRLEDAFGVEIEEYGEVTEQWTVNDFVSYFERLVAGEQG